MTPTEHRAYLQGIAAAAGALASHPQRRSKLLFQGFISGLTPPVGTHEAYLMGSEETADELRDRILDLIAKENEIAKDYAPRAEVIDLATRRAGVIRIESNPHEPDPQIKAWLEQSVYRATHDDPERDIPTRWLTTV